MTETSEMVKGKKPLELAGRGPERVNQFAKNNPKLAALLKEHGSQDPERMREDIAAVMDMCLTKIVGGTDPEDMSKPEFLGLMASMETHKAKIAKLRADTESVMINVATPTAIRNLVNQIGMCILQGNEEVVGEHLKAAKTEAEADAIRSLGGGIYMRIMDKIKAMGYEDNSLVRALAAPR